MGWLDWLLGKGKTTPIPAPPKTGSAASGTPEQACVSSGSAIAGAMSSLGKATLTMLSKLEEMVQRPLSEEERRSLTQSLDTMEGTLGTGMIASSDAKVARARIAAIRARLRQHD